MEYSVEDWKRVIQMVRDRIGNEMLSDRDVMLLACDEVSHTFSYEEKQYGNSN